MERIPVPHTYTYSVKVALGADAARY